MTCIECRAPFDPDPAPLRPGFVPPRRCEACRRARRARLVPVEAVVTMRAPSYAFAASSIGPVFIPAALADELRPQVGDRLALVVDPQPVGEAHRPRAVKGSRA